MHIKISCAHSKLTTPSVVRDDWGLQGRVGMVLQHLDKASRPPEGDVYTVDVCVLTCLDYLVITESYFHGFYPKNIIIVPKASQTSIFRLSGYVNSIKLHYFRLAVHLE